MFVKLTEQQLPQQVFAVRLAPERTPPEEALMIQSVDGVVPLHHHVSWLLGARKNAHVSRLCLVHASAGQCVAVLRQQLLAGVKGRS